MYESIQESSLREDVLGTLDKLVKDWVRRVGEAQQLADSFVADSNAKIFTFGSYRLGVHGPGKADLPRLLLSACSLLPCYCQVVLSGQNPEALCSMQEPILIRCVLDPDMSAGRLTSLALNPTAFSTCYR